VEWGNADHLAPASTTVRRRGPADQLGLGKGTDLPVALRLPGAIGIRPSQISRRDAEGFGLGFENEETAGRVARMLNRMVEAINRCDQTMYKLTLSSYEEIKKTFGAEPASETTSHLDQLIVRHDSLGTEDYIVPLFHENCAKRR